MSSPDLQSHDVEQKHQERPNLNLPIILAGYSGSGKDTVSHATIKVADALESRHQFHHSRSRYTDRSRRPSEIQGIDGFFVTPEEFDTRQQGGEFFFDYKKDEYGGVRYGFSWPKLDAELVDRHTFVVGGEINTAVALKEALDGIAQRSRGEMNHVLHPIILFINRPLENIIAGINMRRAPEVERKKRIAHVEEHWEPYPKALEAVKSGAEFIWNDDLDTSSRQVIQVVEAEVNRQLRHLFGSSSKIKL